MKCFGKIQIEFMNNFFVLYIYKCQTDPYQHTAPVEEVVVEQGQDLHPVDAQELHQVDAQEVHPVHDPELHPVDDPEPVDVLDPHPADYLPWHIPLK
jgi:hypothetical protein